MKIGYFPFKPGGNPYQDLFASALESSGGEVHRIPPEKWFPLQKVVRHDVDILQFDWPHDWYRGKNKLTALLKKMMYLDGVRRLRNKPLVWTAHNLVAHDAENYDYEVAMIQKLIDVSDAIIVLSALSGEKLRETYHLSPGKPVEVIHHGHYIDVYANNTSKFDARQKLGIESDARTVLHLGRLLPYKGIETLMREFSQAAVENSELLIVGSCNSGSYRTELLAMAERYSSENSRISVKPEFVADEDLQFYFAAADLVALPFKNILNSGSLLLAMSFGKCVVAPNVGSIREIACEKGWFAYEEEAQLAEILRRALFCSDLQEREVFVKKFTADNYSWSGIGSKVMQLYNLVTDQASQT